MESRRRWPRRTALCLVLASAVGLGVIYGFLCHERRWPGYDLLRRSYVWAQRNPTLRRVRFFVADRLIDRDRPRGRWDRAPGAAEGGDVEATRQDAVARLQAIGYLAGDEPAGELRGVTTHVPGLAQPGLNLYVSGHGSEAILMNMDGEVLHTWAHEFREAFPDHPAADGQWRLETWTRAEPLAEGDLLVIWERLGLAKLDSESNLLWANPRGFHHDLFVQADDKIYSLSEEVKVLPRIHAYEPVVEDFITVVDADGAILRNVSVLEAFERSSYASFLDYRPPYGDMLHTNTVEVLDGTHADRSAAFDAGNVLISCREPGVIAIVDMEAEAVVWALGGQWKFQHHPTLLDNGNILLLDNQGHRGMSKVIEIDPFTREIVWSYEGTPENGFSTRTLGRSQRLANGNTLVTESTAGRAFEVTPEGRIAWEFYNPARAGEDGELIATLFELRRLGPEGFPWLIPE